MAEQEGVIKYRLDFHSVPLSPDELAWFDLTVFDECRSQMLDLGLIGQDPQRYLGYGFGNLSWRDPQDINRYLISGSQTGHLSQLALKDCALVLGCDPSRNFLQAQGETQPSSESMTHSAVYLAGQGHDSAKAVVHVHSPAIWQYSEHLGLAETAASIPYGTPEMAAAVENITRQIVENHDAPIFVMKGHEDGVLAFAESLQAATEVIVEYQKRALKLSGQGA